MRTLQTELSALESELADPSNPLLQKGKEDDAIDPGELIRGLVDVRGRLQKIRKDKQGRGKLVNLVLGERDSHGAHDSSQNNVNRAVHSTVNKVDDKVGKSDARSIVEIDRRVGELEKLLGSASVVLDEVPQSSSTPSESLMHRRSPLCHNHCSLSSRGSTLN